MFEIILGMLFITLIGFAIYQWYYGEEIEKVDYSVKYPFDPVKNGCPECLRPDGVSIKAFDVLWGKGTYYSCKYCGWVMDAPEPEKYEFNTSGYEYCEKQAFIDDIKADLEDDGILNESNKLR